MAQSLYKAYFHIVFSTKNRVSWIDPNIEQKVYRYLSGVCKNIKCPAFEIGGMPDHIHILLQQSPFVIMPKIVESIKTGSSKWIKTLGPEYQDFSWQRGYGAFSVDYSSFDNVNKYILNQKEHHKKLGFKEEYIMILERYGVEYDVEHLWD